MKTIIFLLKIAAVIFITYPLPASIPWLTDALNSGAQQCSRSGTDATRISQINLIIRNYDNHMQDYRTPVPFTNDFFISTDRNGEQIECGIATAGDGSFTVVWQDDNDGNKSYEIFAAGFNSDGSKRWGDISANINSAGQQKSPTVAMADDGFFVVCWEDDGDKNGVYQIQAAGFNSNGTRRWNDITVNENSAGQQQNPAVAMAADGSFVVVWEDDNDKNGVYQIYAAGFNSNGIKTLDDLTVNNISNGEQKNPAVALADNGYFIVAWEDIDDENSDCQIYAAGFNSNGTKKWGDIKVNNNSAGLQKSPAVAMADDGYFVICWEDDNNNNLYRIYAAGFNSTGARIWGDNVVNSSPSGQQISPSAGISANGYSFLVWNDDNKNILCTSFNNLGLKQFEDFIVNQTSYPTLSLPKISTHNKTNKIDIIWLTSSLDDYKTDISGRILTINAKLDQTIDFQSLPIKFTGDDSFYLSGTASSGLEVTYTSSNTNVATIAGNEVTIVGAGSTVITASQAGNTNYNPANPVSQTLTVLAVNKINEISSQIIKVYPNPVTDILNIDYKEGVYETIYIFNSYGVLLKVEKVITPQQKLDFSKFEKGLYILEFVKPGGKRERMKVITYNY